LSEVILAPPDFSLGTGGPLTLATEHHGSVSITTTPLNGFSGNVTLSCGTLPPYATCEWSNTSTQVSGGPATTQLTIDTSAVLGYASLVAPSKRGTPAQIAFAGLFLPALCLLYRKRKGLGRPLFLLIALCSILTISGCAGKYPGSTPPGTYSITISGTSGSLQHSTILTLIVTN
jgi:hypothetical protein